MSNKLMADLFVDFANVKDPNDIKEFFQSLSEYEKMSMFIGAWTIITGFGTQGAAKGEEQCTLAELVSWEIATLVVSMNSEKQLPFFDIFMHQISDEVNDDNMVIN